MSEFARVRAIFDGAKVIPLTQGKYALVDELDYDSVAKYKWSFDGEYAAHCFGGKKVRLHRFLMNGRLPAGCEVDHINGDKLDNRRSNLRAATRAQNCHNNRTIRRNNHSGVKGIWFRADTGKWSAQLRLGKTTYSLGCFDTREQAANARAKAEEKFHGKYAINKKGEKHVTLTA